MRGERERMAARLGPRMGRDIPSPVASSEGEMAVEIGAQSADEVPMASVTPVALEDEHVSPELALVDPDLAGRLRRALPEPELEAQPPRAAETVPLLRLAPPPAEASDVGPEPVAAPIPVPVDESGGLEKPVLEQQVVVVERPLVEDELPVAHDVPVVVDEPETLVASVGAQDWHVIAESHLLEEPEPAAVREPNLRDLVPPSGGAPSIAALREPERGASLRVEPRPVELGERAPTAVWPPVPPRPRPRRFRIRRVLFTFGIGALFASLAVVGVIFAISALGDGTPRRATIVAAPAAPQAESGQTKRSGSPSSSSSPSSPSSKPAPKQSTPAAPPAAGSRRLVWAPVEGAVSYRVELFRGDRQVLRETTRTPAVDIPARWKHQGRTESLTPGTYRWYVWPVLSSGPAAKAVVQADLVVP
jgi:hypothetical protein